MSTIAVYLLIATITTVIWCGGMLCLVMAHLIAPIWIPTAALIIWPLTMTALCVSGSEK